MTLFFDPRDERQSGEAARLAQARAARKQGLIGRWIARRRASFARSQWPMVGEDDYQTAAPMSVVVARLNTQTEIAVTLFAATVTSFLLIIMLSVLVVIKANARPFVTDGAGYGCAVPELTEEQARSLRQAPGL